MEPQVVFHIEEKDKIRFEGILRKFFQYMKQKTESEAIDLSISVYNYLIRGLDLDGKPINDPNFQHFDEIIQDQTKYFYSPNATQRIKYKRGSKLKVKKKKNGEREALAEEREAKARELKIKKNLLFEYPSLDRKDLEESIENYCKLIVKVNILMSGNITENNVAIKNLTETMIKLGSFLGINEGKKAEQKALQDRQSIASLSVEFQRTIDKYPEIVDRMKYQELRILLEKYDNQSLGISKELFESTAYAAMSVQQARDFINEREAKYEQKD